jgi:hypothetical protein
MDIKHRNLEEYGTAFAVNCTAWAIALLWSIANLRQTGGVPLAVDGKVSGACVEVCGCAGALGSVK